MQKNDNFCMVIRDNVIFKKSIMDISKINSCLRICIKSKCCARFFRIEFF